jgi:hypothetical protein
MPVYDNMGKPLQISTVPPENVPKPANPFSALGSLWTGLVNLNEQSKQNFARNRGLLGQQTLAPTVAAPAQPTVTSQQPVMRIDEVAERGLNQGVNARTKQEQTSLLGGALDKLFGNGAMRAGVDRLLELSIRPEAITPQLGDRPFSPLLRAASAQRMEERQAAAAQAQAEAEFQNKAMLQAMKGGELTGIGMDVLDRLNSNREGLKLIEDMKAIATSNKVGGTSSITQGLKTLLRGFNVDIAETESEQYRNRIASLIATLQSSSAFGRELSKTDYDTLGRILSDPGIFSNPSQLISSLKPLEDKLVRSQQDLRQRADFLRIGPLAEQRITPGFSGRSGTINPNQ